MKSANGWLSDSVDNLSNRIVSDFLNHARVGLAIRQSDVVAFAQGKELLLKMYQLWVKRTIKVNIF